MTNERTASFDIHVIRITIKQSRCNRTNDGEDSAQRYSCSKLPHRCCLYERRLPSIITALSLHWTDKDFKLLCKSAVAYRKQIAVWRPCNDVMPHEARRKFLRRMAAVIARDFFEKKAPVHSKIKLLFPPRHNLTMFRKYYLVVILKRSCTEETAQLQTF